MNFDTLFVYHESLEDFSFFFMDLFSECCKIPIRFQFNYLFAIRISILLCAKCGFHQLTVMGGRRRRDGVCLASVGLGKKDCSECFKCRCSPFFSLLFSTIGLFEFSLELSLSEDIEEQSFNCWANLWVTDRLILLLLTTLLLLLLLLLQLLLMFCLVSINFCDILAIFLLFLFVMLFILDVISILSSLSYPYQPSNSFIAVSAKSCND